MKKPVNIGVFQIRDRRLEQFLFYHDIFFVDSHQCEDGSMIWEYEDCPYFCEVLLEWKEILVRRKQRRINGEYTTPLPRKKH